MSARKRGNTWWVDFSYKWNRYRMRSPDNSSAGAKIYESTLRQKLARGEGVDQSYQAAEEKKIMPTYSQFASEWLEKYARANNKYSEFVNKTSILNANLLPFFGRFQLSQISNRIIEEYKAEKIKTGLSPKSINNHLTVLRKSLKTAQEWEIVEKVPMIKLLRVDPTQTIFLSPEEYEKLLANCEGQCYEMVYLTLNTGLRVGELMGLKWIDVDLERKVLTVQRAIYRSTIGSTKSNKIRKIPLTDGLVEMLVTKPRNTNGFIFNNGANNPFIQTRCDKMIKKAAMQAELPKIGWHTLRHTFASNLANKGVAIQHIQALLGHTDIKTTMRYSHISSIALVDAVSKLQIDLKICHKNVTNAKNGEKDRRTMFQQIVKEIA
ncbi:MAG: site-specific integrase [Candidatus Magasanikbacteria bacterium]|nr:site-specific integrase [Candidatus Magasanikbacteria bacterium]